MSEQELITTASPQEQLSERHYVEFDLKAFAKELRVPLSRIAEKLFISSLTLYQQAAKGIVPLKTFKALVFAFAPERVEALEQGIVIKTKSGYPHRISRECAALADEYDRLRPGARIPMEGGGWWMIPGKAEIEALTKAAPEPIAVVEHVDASIEERIDAVLSLASKIKHQRDTERLGRAHDRRKFEEELVKVRTERQAEITGLERQVRELEGRVTTLSAELESWQALAEDASHPEASPGFNTISQNAVKSLTPKVMRQFPGLVEDIKSLPFRTARPAS